MDPAERVPSERSHGRPRTPFRGPGNLDAEHDPSGFGARLPGAGRRGSRRTTRLVVACGPPHRGRRHDGANGRAAARPPRGRAAPQARTRPYPRCRTGDLERARPVGGPGPRPALRDLGAAERRPLRPGRCVDGRAGGYRGRGHRLLIRRYLGGSGPSTTKEISGWSGVPGPHLEGVLARMRLRRFRSERGEVLHDLHRAPLPAADTPAPIRFLPTWDATLLINERATQILPEHHRPRVFNTKTPHSVPTFLVDGQVAGTWHVEGGRVRVEPFERLLRGGSDHARRRGRTAPHVP
ncbi:MAG: winged helix DNA-binding domain-containing protein [Actinobacteria bacterium]|nr:MAG: winged helix DNA-binding domain-containing protein [Actinomycetota bacterium]